MGLFSLLITNCIVNKENRAFVHYLELKVQQDCNRHSSHSSQSVCVQVEQYMAQHQRNIQAIPPDDPVQDI